jgi:organic radical activating enzyme
MIKEIINNKPSNVLVIEYGLGNLCNHKCNYCFPGSNEGNMPWPNVESAKRNLDHLMTTYEAAGKNKFELFLVGGEPTLWKDLPNLLRFLKAKHDCVVRIVSNGSRGVDWWKENAHNFDHVEISVHHEFADVAHISEVCDALYNQDTNVVANVLMDPSNFTYCQDIVKQLTESKHEWPILAKAVLYNGVVNYTPEQKTYCEVSIKRMPDMDWYYRTRKIEPESYDVILETDEKKSVKETFFTLNSICHFYNWSCDLGLSHIRIGFDGCISGNCGQKIYGTDYFYLYDDAFTEKFNPAIGPVQCKQVQCSCSYEVTISKRRLFYIQAVP